MPKYSVSNLLAGTQQAISSSYKTLVEIHPATGALRRGKIKEIIIGFDGTPANNAITVDVSRTTGAGTATAATPQALDPADPAALLVAGVNHTVEPTVTAGSSLLNIAVNQQATVRWLADQGEELVMPATNLAGICIRVKSASYTGTAVCTVVFEE